MAYPPHEFNLTCDIYPTSMLNFTEPSGPPTAIDVPCSTRTARPSEAALLPSLGTQTDVIIIGMPVGTIVQDRWGVTNRSGPPWPSLIELPPESGNFYQPWSAEIVARGWPNQYLKCVCFRQSHNPPVE